MKSKLLFNFLLLFAFAKTLSSQTVSNYPATEVYLINIRQSGNNFSLADSAKPINISNNKGYDNQPMFIEPLNSIAYVSSRNNGPTDVYLYNLTAGNVTQFTNTTEAEFSPKLTPDGKFISVVKGAEQNLTRISLDGKTTEKLYTSKDSIGYYCWIDSDEIAAVVLTKPISLKLINIKTKTEKFLTDSAGRSLFKYSADNGIVLCRTLKKGNSIWCYSIKPGLGPLPRGFYQLIELPPNNEDFYLTDDGWIFSSNGSTIVYCNINKTATGWQVLADLKSMGISKIFRLSVNQQKNKLVFVAEEK